MVGALETRDEYFWGTHAGAELDLLLTFRGKRYGFEFKYADAPGRSRSMQVAIQDLQLEHVWVVYPGDQEYSLDARITVIPVHLIAMVVDDLREGSSERWRRRPR